MNTSLQLHPRSQSLPVQSPPRAVSAEGASVVSQAARVAPSYGLKQGLADIDKLARTHILAGEYRGVSSAHLAEFNRDKKAIVQAAMDAAKRYFPELGLKDGTRLLLATMALESTFNPKLNAEDGVVRPDKTIGLTQSRAASNLLDFKRYASGKGLTRADGKGWDPRKTPDQDLLKIRENVFVGAWYMSTTARIGATSPYEHFEMGRKGPAPKTVRTGLLSHFLGPNGAAANPNTPGAQRYLRLIAGELDYLQGGTSKRVLGTPLKPVRV